MRQSQPVGSNTSIKIDRKGDKVSIAFYSQPDGKGKLLLEWEAAPKSARDFHKFLGECLDHFGM